MYYVYFNDDCTSNGGIGLESFFNYKSVLEFIRERMDAVKDRGSTPVPSNYTVIEGTEYKLIPVSIVESWQLKRIDTSTNHGIE